MLLDWIMPGNTARSNSPRFDGETLATAANVSPMRPDPASVLDTPQEAKHTDKQRQAEFTSRLTQRTWELATRDSNPATDLLVCLERNRDIGFRYTDVRRQLVITHGTEDKRVPLANVKWLVDQFNVCSYDMGSKPRCELRVLPGEGHGLMASAPIMGGVLTELAGY
ncbi:hypothetical protein K470DRAFT_255757 [Piedraia hortae CBS 480.64]|uniref:Uncharacterized protein n=1 Tax=Piedraia hortae CBS 480.64 TaxID=1314780 RepID=A0A6A7C5J6_9PEZI|nr:hypothetical protein K470DRAFT_255757 [Piedraia hortae CBS 480.64]